MGYADIDPVLREGFQRTLPFKWNELTIQSPAEASFMADALSHGVGPHGFSIPVVTKHGHRALFSMSFSRSEQEWANFLTTNRSTLIQIANRLHRRGIWRESAIPDDKRARVSALDRARQGQQRDRRHFAHFSAYRTGLFEVGSL